MDVIYLTGGKGKRVNIGFPKQYAQIGGKYLFMYGLEIFEKIKEIDNIIIPADDIDKINRIVDAYDIKKHKIIKGGQTRQESVFNGLKHVKSKEVLIAEAVRPFISIDFVLKIIKNDGNVIPYSLINSTPFDYINGDILNRDRVVCVQTPQKYITNEILESHEAAINFGINNTTDDLDLMKKVGLYNNFNYFEGLRNNIKITYPEDLFIANCFIYSNSSGGLNE